LTVRKKTETSPRVAVRIEPKLAVQARVRLRVKPALHRLAALARGFALQLLDLPGELSELRRLALGRAKVILRVHQRPVVVKHLRLDGLCVRIDRRRGT
jgi:hypothetical protein